MKNLAEVLVFGRQDYHLLSEYLGDVDLLRNNQRQLIGFSFILGECNEQEDAVCRNLSSQSMDITNQDGVLLVLLKREQYEIQIVQAVGTVIYRSNSNDLMIAIPDWGFGKLGFELITADVPTIKKPSTKQTR